MSSPTIKRKVLIADDEPNIVTALEFLLRRAGYEVRSAADGDEALALVDSYAPDLMLVDVMMPGKSGYEVCQRVRARPELAGVKIVMISAKGRERIDQGERARRRRPEPGMEGLSAARSHHVTIRFGVRPRQRRELRDGG